MRKNIVFLLVIVCLFALLGFGTTVVAAENDFELSVEQMGVDYAYLEWTSQPDAQGYSVFRSLNNNSYSLIKSTENSYTYNYIQPFLIFLTQI